jgi:uncharacterized membrane protein
MADNILARQDTNTMALVAYVCMLIGLMFPLAFIVGLVIAYIYRGSDESLDSHFNNVIRVFWWTIPIGIVGAITAIFVIGWFILLGLYIWIIIRMAKGLGGLRRGVAFGD